MPAVAFFCVWFAFWIGCGWWSVVRGPTDPLDRVRYQTIRAMEKQMRRDRAAAAK